MTGAVAAPQVALVSGTSRGIGLAIARAFHDSGYSVAALGRDAKTLTGAVEGLPRTLPLACDVRDTAAVETALLTVEAKLGPVQVLVNNAGVGGPFHVASEVSDEEWDQVFDTNVKGCRNLCRLVLPRMKAAGFGRIIHIGSVLSERGAAGSSTYAASKHALLGYSRSLAVEWGGFGITSNVVCPGYIATEMTEARPQGAAGLVKRIPTGRLGAPEDVARIAVFLAAPESRYVNGACWTVDGGLSAAVD